MKFLVTRTTVSSIEVEADDPQTALREASYFNREYDWVESNPVISIKSLGDNN